MGHTYKETDASETWCKVRRQRANAVQPRSAYRRRPVDERAQPATGCLCFRGQIACPARLKVEAAATKKKEAERAVEMVEWFSMWLMRSMPAGSRHGCVRCCKKVLDKMDG